ncbi:MAG: hypothetical protein JSR80_02420 [Verrucomicrobia bacterium]|nr:hypothetical protein [Verrucomicrobiota bacterium]
MSEDVQKRILNAYTKTLQEQGDFYKKPVEELRSFVLKGELAIYTPRVNELGRCKALVEEFPALRQKLEKAQGTLKFFAWSGVAVGAGLLVFQIHNFKSFFRTPDHAISGRRIARFVISTYLAMGGLVGSGVFAGQSFFMASKGRIAELEKEEKLFNAINQEVNLEIVNTWLEIKK